MFSTIQKKIRENGFVRRDFIIACCRGVMYESYRRESTDFSRAIFPRSLASRTRARVSFLFTSIHDLDDDTQERDKDKREILDVPD